MIVPVEKFEIAQCIFPLKFCKFNRFSMHVFCNFCQFMHIRVLISLLILTAGRDT